MKLYTIAFFSLLIIILSCKKPDKKQQIDINEIVKVEVEKDSFAAIMSEKIKNIEHTAIIYFLPTNQERKEIAKEFITESEYEIVNIFNSFINQYTNIKSIMKKYNIPVELSYSKEFYFIKENNDTFYMNIENKNQIMGVIFFNKKENPLFLFGTPKPSELQTNIRNYFKIKNFNLFLQSDNN